MKNYFRSIIYFPGNTGLKKTKYQIDTDFNPLINGILRQNAHLCAISVKSFSNFHKTNYFYS